MKKFLCVFISLLLLSAAFTGCGASANPDSTAANGDDDVFHIGIVQLTQHPSLDEICNAIVTEIKDKGYGDKIQIDIKNAQGDTSNINTICQKFVGDNVDLIVAIATPAAQGALNATSDIPIIFSAVSDPVGAGLLTDINQPEGNITGTSDAISVENIFKMAGELTPDAKNFGLIYNPGEANSVSVINEAKAYMEEHGYTFTEATVTNSGDVAQASQSLVGSNVDAIFAPIDNTVASAMTLLADTAVAAKIPVYVSADSMVADGGLATVGVNYTDLGKQTADMVIDVLINGKQIKDIPVEVMSDYTTVVNQETADAIGVDVSKYAE